MVPVRIPRDSRQTSRKNQGAHQLLIGRNVDRSDPISTICGGELGFLVAQASLLAQPQASATKNATPLLRLLAQAETLAPPKT